MFRLLAPLLLAALTCAAQCTLTLQPNLPTGALGAAYPGAVVHGGAGPWTYSIAGGALPNGLSVAPNGGAAIFTGSAAAAGTFDFNLRVTDSAGCLGAANLRIVIGGDLAVQPALLANGATGRLYAQSFGLNAGSVALPVTSASLLSGTLPQGLNIVNSGGTWVLSGTPTGAGSFDFTVQVTGGAGFSASRRYVVTIAGVTTVVSSPSSLLLTARLGESPLPAQRLDIAAADGGSYRYRVSAASPGFRIENAAGEFATPFTLTPNVQPLSSVPGAYTGYIELVAVDGLAPTVRIPVELIVQPPPNLLVDTSAITVSMRQNDPPVTRGIPVSSSGAPLTYAVETLTPIGGNWLTLTPALGETPANLNVVFNPVGLPAGVYSGTIRIAANRNGVSAIGSPKVIAVSLTVDAPNPTSGFAASPGALSFTGQVGTTPSPAQPLRISNAGGPISWSATGNVPWLGLNQLTGTTPSDILVSVFPGGLAAGTHTGAFTFTSGATSIVVPVTLTLAPAPPSNTDPVLRVYPDSVVGSVTATSPQFAWTVNVDGIGGQYNVEFNPTVPWLTTSPPGGTTPTGFNLLADATKLQPGTHQGAVIVVTTNPNGLKTSSVVNVTLYVSGNATPSAPGLLQTTSSTLFFDWRQGASVPRPKLIGLSSSGLPVNWDAISTVSWINLSRAAGTTPSEIEVSVSPQFLGAGNYRGEVRFRRGTEEVSVVTVLLSIGGAGALRANPSALVYLVETGRDVAPQLFTLGRFDSDVSANYSVRSAPDWLAVAPPSGKTPAQLEAVIRRDRLPQATTTVLRLEGEVAIESEAGGVRIPILVTIVPPQGSPAGREAPWILSVTNAASTQPGPVAPGEHVTLYGGFEGREARVFFDANRAPLLVQEPNQLTVAVPFAVAGRASTRVRVEVDSLASRDLELRVVDTAPGIFTKNGSGRGFAVTTNEDATPGSFATLELTGLGATDPQGTDGAKVAEGETFKPIAAVEVRVGGLVSDTVTCATPVGSVQGAMRCEFRVPPGMEAGDHPLLVTVGGIASQPGVLFRVRQP